MRILSMIAVAVFLSTLAPQARADMAEDCAQERDPDLSIGGCTAAIHSGEWQGTDLAWAYYNRGSAYDDLGDHRRAIEDYTQALRLDPGDGSAYQNRGVSHESLGEYARAAADWERAIRIDGASRAEWWQNYMKGKGHYAGAIDGVFTPGLRRDLLACAIDPAC